MNNTKRIYTGLLVLGSLTLVTACGPDGKGSPGIVAPIQEILEPVPEAPKVADPLPAGLLEEAIRQGVPPTAATLAFDRYEKWRPKIRNGKFLSLIDFTQHSGRPRLFVIDVASGKVDAIHVAHAKNSDTNDDGVANSFGNVPNSKKSSLGSYLVAEKYYGKYGGSMKLDGLEPTNSMVRARTIVMHPSKYVTATRSKQGRSWGCPAVPYAWIETLISRLRDGSFMFAYSNVAASSATDNLEIDQIMLNPAYRWLNEAEEAPVDGE